MKKTYIPFIAITAAITIYSCKSGNEESSTTTTPATENAAETKATESSSSGAYSKGETVYKEKCVACHQANGEGIAGAFPPLAKSDYLLADKNRAIKQIITGSNAEIVVNGVTYKGAMPPQDLNDEQIADVLNYVLNSWGNNGGEVTVDDVKKQR